MLSSTHVSVSDIQSVVRVMNMLSSHVSVSDIQSVVRVMNMLSSTSTQ
jgi:hypothetical protein